ncbi:unnamed protein product [Paramecium pentaurelia]|uniref:Tetratricopeptide repeat protein n=1 Tax=Paramecium pentaurelia TaxID=43138 RepID=A0A8S1U3A2_9CILI|nr:unnamed protein product [Paramecium pentaurelia]
MIKIELTKSGDQIISDDQDQIKIEEINDESEDKNGYNIKEAERLFKEEVALDDLKKYQEAIECQDKAISINLKNDNAWFIKGYSFHFIQDSIECYDKAICINLKYDMAWNNKGYALHQLQKYPDAILCYDQALSININLQNYNEKLIKTQIYIQLIHYLNQGRNQKPNSYIWLHWKTDQMTQIIFRNNYQSYEALLYISYNNIKYVILINCPFLYCKDFLIFITYYKLTNQSLQNLLNLFTVQAEKNIFA